MPPRCLRLLLLLGIARALHFFDGTTTSSNGSSYLTLLDSSYRMLAPSDAELMTVSGCVDGGESALTEGAQWAGNFWTQNSYGFAFSSTPFLHDAIVGYLQQSFLWWYDHVGDGGQFYGGLPDVPAGMLCDGGNPTSCTYMQCGPGRAAALVSRNASKRAASVDQYKSSLGDTEGLGQDWIIEGTLAATIMQADLLLATRNISGARDHFLPIFKATSDFLETRRVQDASPLTPGAAGLLYAGNGANLLAPAYGGQGLPAGCLVNASCGTDGFPACCEQFGFGYLTGLTVTYSAALDRLVALEELAYPDGRACTVPSPDAPGFDGTCAALYRARRAANDAALPAMFATMAATNTTYLIRSLDPDGERHGVYEPRGAPCAVDEPCPPQARHGYFETSPNVDAIALRVASPALAAELYASMRSVEGLAPCDFTLSNFPEYDDSCGDCLGPFGRWVSGGSWSTVEARVVAAHLNQRRYDLAAASAARLVDVYARLFKLDNPISHQGCGPGMYSEMDSGRGSAGPILDIDVFGIPAAFVRGLLAPEYGATELTLHPRLPDGIDMLRQRFPVRWGGARLFVTMVYSADGAEDAPRSAVTDVLLNGTACAACVGADAEAVSLAWEADVPVAVVIVFGGGVVDRAALPPQSLDGAAAAAEWRSAEAAREAFDPAPLDDTPCAFNDTVVGWAVNATAFSEGMRAAGLGARYEAAQARALLQAFNASATRCVGRADGSLAPIPAQPEAWDKYDMAYNQSAVEDYFPDVYRRIWTALNSRIASYDRDNASPEESQILAIFRGSSTADAARVARRVATHLLDAHIQELEAELTRRKAQRDEL